MAVRAAYQNIAGPSGTLQLLVEEPGHPPAALAIICHPHPLYGGSLTNKVVHQLTRAFLQLNAVSVRFNFRGVGESEGEYDEGRGELQDLLAVTDWARQQWPDQPLWLAGFSFGGAIALQGAAELHPQSLVTVAPAIKYLPTEPLSMNGIHWLLIQGSDDEVVAAADVIEWCGQFHPGPHLEVLEGVSHFFHGRLIDLKNAVLSGMAEG